MNAPTAFSRLALPAALALALPLTAAPGPRLPFAFEGPEILKTDWSTRALQAVDFDGDGLRDLALINNDSARIELFYQLDPDAPASEKRARIRRNRWEPVLEDARFENESLPVGFQMFDLAVGDLNGDGRPDLAYTAREVPLTVRFQGESGGWTETSEFEQLEALGWVSTLAVEDLDKDGSDELIALSADALRVFRPEDEDLGEPRVYPLTGENPFNLMLADVSGDGLPDLLYISTDGLQSLTVREQLADLRFGPERRFPLERPVRGIEAMPVESGEPPVFCAVNSRSGGLELFSIDPGTRTEGGLSEAQPEIYPVTRSGGRGPASYALADLDGDGFDDVLAAPPGAAELAFYGGREGGFGAPRMFPGFADVTSLAIGRFEPDGGASVALVSVTEKLLGHSRMDPGGRLSFPEQIVLPRGEPLSCRAFDADGDGVDELAVAVEDANVMRVLLLRAKAEDSEEGRPRQWELLSSTELEGVRRKPSAIRVIDAFPGGRSGLMVFVPRESPVFLSAEADEPFELKPRAVDSSIRESLLKDLSPAQVSCFDVDGDGAKELVVGRTGYARALRFEGERLEMVDQFNARRSEDSVSAVVPLEEGPDRVERILLYTETTGELQFLERDADGVFRLRESNEVGAIRPSDWRMALAAGESPASLFLAGEDRFWRLPMEGRRWERVELSSYETDLEDVHFSYVEGVDLDGEGDFEIIAVDGAEHVVEIAGYHDGDWSSRMYWQIFEQNMHYQGRTGANLEPREVLSTDLDGNLSPDFLLLVHDRILIYPQE